jgi:hypothetical protein
MTESIGNVYSTAIPALSDTADIQEALRIYHYGAPSGSGAGQYPITNTDPTNLVIPSVAYHLYALQTAIDNFEAGVLPSAFTEKGVLLSASQPGTPRPLAPGPNGQVLTTNSATTTGLEWRVPEVTLTNTVTLSNKTLTNGSITSAGIRFVGPAGNSFATTLVIPTPTANKTVSLPESSIIPTSSTTLVGTDTVQTLTNKTIAVGQLSGQVPIASGGTGASNAAVARSNLEIFRGTTSSPFSGKVYVADPSIVGTNGAGLVGAAAGDLWFW